MTVPGLVSVVVPTHDRADQVGGAVESVLAQTYADLEVVVVDDASTDRTPSVLDAYAEDDRVRVLRNETNRGVAATRNRGLNAARGQYVCPLDDDDRWHPEKLSRQVERLESLGEGYCGVYTAGRIVAPDGTVRERVDEGTSGDLFPEVLVEMCVRPHSGHLVRARCLEAVGGYDPTFNVACDWDLVIRLARRWRFGYVPSVLVERTEADDNLTGDPAYDVRARELVTGKHAAALAEVDAPTRRAFAAAAHRERGLYALHEGARWRAAREFVAATRAEPTPTHLILTALSPLGPGALDAARRLRDRSPLG